jgi:ABC-type transporter Mla maintaining outer membrane lipid asymmetry ATPase subunit MlaF
VQNIDSVNKTLPNMYMLTHDTQAVYITCDVAVVIRESILFLQKMINETICWQMRF